MKTLLSPARLNAMPAYLAFMMLAIGAISFLYNRLFSLLTESLSFTLPAASIYVAIAIVPAMLAFASFRAWGDRSVKAVMYLSLALYLPSVIGVSRIDLLKATGFSYNFSIFSSGLHPALIALSGILLACGWLSLRSFAYTKAARTNFLARGADAGEVDDVLYHHASLEAKVIGASAAVVIVFFVGVPLLEVAILWVLQSAKFFYVLAGLGAALLLALVILVQIKGIKR
ncbi:MAG TPA: hypothetical protein VGJ92_05060 [Methanocella sp.]|jgi:hypothetical protein